ncbi:MAG: DUF1738 domain-containing protein [Bacteroidales bacterium]|nr:DUF1738 domain-containing protein [Bacteroidales bacterium]
MDIYAEITSRVLATLETGEIPWEKPWVGNDACVGHKTGKPYSLLNQLLLGKPGEYLTFLQAQAEGGRIKPGEKSRFVVFWKMQEELDKDTGEIKQKPCLRFYRVFHLDQTEGIEAKYDGARQLSSHAETDSTAEAVAAGYMSRSGVDLMTGNGNMSAYSPADDLVIMPAKELFRTTAGYYSTLFHEFAHSTGNEHRLARFDGHERFGNAEYSKEELIAELAAAMVMHSLGMETDRSFRNSAAYLQGWLHALRNDKRMIVFASGKAEAAARLILGTSETAETVECAEEVTNHD